MMDTSRIVHLFLQYLPEFFIKSMLNQKNMDFFFNNAIITFSYFLTELSYKENNCSQVIHRVLVVLCHQLTFRRVLLVNRLYSHL